MKKYWICIIKVNAKSKNSLPVGFDAPPRCAAIEAVEKETPVMECWSGWGMNEENFKAVMEAWHG